MIRPLLALLFVGTPAVAAERSVAVVNFDRIRIDGAFDVRLTTRATPRATIGGDARALESVDVRVDGGTLVVRAGNTRWGERPVARGIAAPVVYLQTRDLRSAGVVGGGTLSIAGPVAADRVDLTVTGAGTLNAPQLAAGELTVTLIGPGQLTLAGTARRGRLLSNGSGTIAAGELTVGDLVVRTEGTTAVTVGARYTASATSTGLGPIAIVGRPECSVKALADGPIRCTGTTR